MLKVVLAFPTFPARTITATALAVTKMPTHKTIMVLFMRLDSREHEGGQHEIEPEDSERGGDNRARGRTRHSFCRRRGVVTLEKRDGRDRDPEHHALDHPVHDVLPEVHRVVHLRPESALVSADHDHRDQVAAEYADGAEYRREQRHRDDPAPETRADHACDRVHRHHL